MEPPGDSGSEALSVARQKRRVVLPPEGLPVTSAIVPATTKGLQSHGIGCEASSSVRSRDESPEARSSARSVESEGRGVAGLKAAGLSGLFASLTESESYAKVAGMSSHAIVSSKKPHRIALTLSEKEHRALNRLAKRWRRSLADTLRSAMLNEHDRIEQERA